MMATRRTERFESDHTRVITRLFRPGNAQRVRGIVDRILAMPEEEVEPLLTDVLQDFSKRHRRIERVFSDHFTKIRNMLIKDGNGQVELPPALMDPTNGMSPERKLLIGAYFTLEYSVEAAAFFNPSIVPHPDQSGLAEGSVRFILSFRAVGEGHISSIVFRSGVIGSDDKIFFDPVSRFAQTPDVVPDPSYEKKLFILKLKEMGFHNFTTGAILGGLPEFFSFRQLSDAMKQERVELGEQIDTDTLRMMEWLADSNYELHFAPDQPISECVIFPVSANELNGIEDARFVRFVEDDGEVIYYATYTAFNGIAMVPQLIETRDFHNFKISTLNGNVAQNKGMALFPRKINGQYMMITRHDGENMFLATSDNPHFWHKAELLQAPQQPWELVQVGNCGSPIETEAGWLLLTHGVGPMRRYCIGALLLDLDDPSKVIGRLNEPLLSPQEVEREGYVPNVVYSCGGLIHKNHLILPYAMSDTASGIATSDLNVLIERLLDGGRS